MDELDFGTRAKAQQPCIESEQPQGVAGTLNKSAKGRDPPVPTCKAQPDADTRYCSHSQTVKLAVVRYGDSRSATSSSRE